MGRVEETATGLVLRRRLAPTEALGLVVLGTASAVLLVLGAVLGVGHLATSAGVASVAEALLLAGVLQDRLLVAEDHLVLRRLGWAAVVPWPEVQGVEQARGRWAAAGLQVDAHAPRRRGGRPGFVGWRVRSVPVSRFDPGFPTSGPVVEALRRHRPDLGL